MILAPRPAVPAGGARAAHFLVDRQRLDGVAALSAAEDNGRPHQAVRHEHT